jgi:hypothetical protein
MLVTVVSLWAPSLTRGRVFRMPNRVCSILVICQYIQKYLFFICLIYKVVYMQYIQGLCQSRLSTANYVLLIVIHGITAVYTLERSYTWLAPKSKSKSHYDRQLVWRPSGTCDQFFFLLEILFRQLRVRYFVAPLLTRGWVRNLLLLVVLASAVPLGSTPSDKRSGLSFVSISL